MDIAALSMVSSQMKFANQISVAVTKMAMSTATENTTDLIKVLESSVQPGKGASIDIKV